jgi:hypothetical protein
LSGTKDVTCWNQSDVHTANGVAVAKVEHMFEPLSREPCLHQARRASACDDLRVLRDMVAMRVRDKSEWFWIPRIKPEAVCGQLNAAMIMRGNHPKTRRFGRNDRTDKTEPRARSDSNKQVRIPSKGTVALALVGFPQRLTPDSSDV